MSNQTMGFSIDLYVCFLKPWFFYQALCSTEISITYRSKTTNENFQLHTVRAIPSSSCTAHSHIPIFHTMSTSKEWLSAAALETEACDCSELLNTTSHWSECIYLARNSMQFKIGGRWLKSSQIHQYTFYKHKWHCHFYSEEVFPYYFTAGWAGSNWILQNGRSMIYSWWRMPTNHTCLFNHFALGSLLLCLGSWRPDIFVSSKKYLPYTNLQDTLKIDHIPAFLHIHFLWKPTTQLLLRYLKGHNATLHIGFESKANWFACCICTDAFSLENNNFCGRLRDDWCTNNLKFAKKAIWLWQD